jgi:hypothetical protein
MPLTTAELLDLSPDELDDLFALQFRLASFGPVRKRTCTSASRALRPQQPA